MKREGIAYGPVIGYTALLIAASGALGWVVTGSWYPLAILLVPVIGIAAYRLIGLYSDSIRRVTFMFNAIDNDDFTFRFHEDPSKVDNGMLNAALNRIKEILVRAKVRAEERERYYQLIMEYARTGLITINDAGSVYQANGEALRIFGLPRLTHTAPPSQATTRPPGPTTWARARAPALGSLSESPQYHRLTGSGTSPSQKAPTAISTVA